MDGWGIYGAYGYTGALAARRAVEVGERPVLLGRDASKLANLAGELGLEHRRVPINDRNGLRDALVDLTTVLNCAGPYQDSAAPMVEACLDTRTHYVDVGAELEVLESLEAFDDAAVASGIVILPAMGFDAAPSECLSLHVSDRLPTATWLRVVVDPNSPPSRGTATSALRDPYGPMIRSGGALERLPVAARTITVDFGFDRGVDDAVLTSWGDLSLAHRSTGIDDIETYSVFGAQALRTLRLARLMALVVRIPAVARAVAGAFTGSTSGPGEEQLEGRRSWVFAEVGDGDGGRAASRLQVPSAYLLTAAMSVDAAVRLSAGEVEPGFRTPAGAFGPDFILGFDGVEREDVPA